MASSLRASPRQRAAHLCGLIRAAGRSEDKVALFGSTYCYQGKHSFHISIHVVMLQATEGPSHRVHGYASHPKLPFAKKQSDRYCITVAHCPGHVNPKDSHPPPTQPKSLRQRESSRSCGSLHTSYRHANTQVHSALSRHTHLLFQLSSWCRLSSGAIHTDIRGIAAYCLVPRARSRKLTRGSQRVCYF